MEVVENTNSQLASQNETGKGKIVRRPTDDIITELPPIVIERILACLPIRDAVRTCILSSQWRYKWVTILDITIDDRCIVTSSRDVAVIINFKLKNFVDRLLLLHRGPIEKFKLSISTLQSCSDIDQWILFLSRNSIKDFTLRIPTGGRYEVPTCLSFCKQLTHLELSGCIFKSPPKFDGFNNLKNLCLHQISFVGCTIESLISRCPLLERLTLLVFDGCTDFKINAPNLKYLHLLGLFESLCIQNARLLSTASIDLRYNMVGNGKVPQRRTSMIQFSGCLASVEKLNVQTFFLKFLGLGVPNRLPNTLNNLKELRIGLFINDLDEFAAALCLIRSAPNLQLLKIVAILIRNANLDPILQFFKTQDSSNCTLNQLRFVDVMASSFKRTLLEFIKFLLANTLALEMMAIKLNKEEVAKMEILQDLLRLRRASPKAQICILDL